MVSATQARDFVESLIDLPVDKRKGKLNDYFVELSTADGSARTMAMESLMHTTAALAPESRREYLRLRTEVLTELEMNTQMAILGTYREILLTMKSEQAKMEVDELKAIQGALDPKYHQMVERFVHFLPREATGQPTIGDTASPPDGAGRKWWQFWSKS